MTAYDGAPAPRHPSSADLAALRASLYAGAAHAFAAPYRPGWEIGPDGTGPLTAAPCGSCGNLAAVGPDGQCEDCRDAG